MEACDDVSRALGDDDHGRKDGPRAGTMSGIADRRPRWELWRQDDNGNRDRIGLFDTQAAARRALDRFEALGHKQIYWLEERAGG